MVRTLDFRVGRNDVTVCDPYFVGLGTRSAARYRLPSGAYRLEVRAVAGGPEQRLARGVVTLVDDATVEWRDAPPVAVDSGLICVSSRPDRRIATRDTLAKLASTEGCVSFGDAGSWTFSCGQGDGEVAVREGFDRRGRLSSIAIDCLRLQSRPPIAAAASRAADGDTEWTTLAATLFGGAVDDERNQVLVQPSVNRKLAVIERDLAERLLGGEAMDYVVTTHFADDSAVAAALDVVVDGRRSFTARLE